VRVQLKDLLDGMEFQSDEITAYLHRPTGRVVAASEEALHAAEEGDQVEEFELADARGILEGGDDYLALPDRFEINEYQMMARFAAGVADAAAQADLENAPARSGRVPALKRRRATAWDCGGMVSLPRSGLRRRGAGLVRRARPCGRAPSG
jgi:hypothetical protein